MLKIQRDKREIQKGQEKEDREIQKQKDPHQKCRIQQKGRERETK